jgi:hypothetical protein
MGWGLDKDKVRAQWGEWTRFQEVAQGDQPAGLDDMIGRPFRWPQGPESHETAPDEREIRLEPAGTPEANYALAQLAQLTETRVLTAQEFDVFQARVRGG